MDPRPLTDRERDSVLLLLPEGRFPGVQAYRSQVDAITVTGACGCGCPSIDFSVDHAAVTQAVVPKPSSGPLPVEGAVDDGENSLWLMLWAEDGWLTGLEISWIDESPQELPDPSVWALSPGR